jgi:hypothetical protein
MWAENRPLSEIAEAIGVSRSAIAGRIDRARRAGDARFAPRPAKLKPQPAAKARQVKPVAEAVGNARPAKPVWPVRENGYLLIEMDSWQCRFAVNNSVSKGELHRFCGAPTTPAAYCKEHKAALAHTAGDTKCFHEATG